MSTPALPAAVEFSGTQLSIIDRDHTPWVTATDLAKALGYEDTSAITRIHARHSSEFTDAMTGTVNLTVPNQSRQVPVRIFSPRGAHLVAMFARTDRAAAFRRWVLDVLEGLAQPPQAPALPLAGQPMLVADRRMLTHHVMCMIDQFDLSSFVIDDLVRDGRIPAVHELNQLRANVVMLKEHMRRARLSMEHAESQAKKLLDLPIPTPKTTRSRAVPALDRAASPGVLLAIRNIERILGMED